MKKRTIIIISILLVVLIVIITILAIYFSLFGTYKFAPDMSEFDPYFKDDGIYLIEDYQEDDFYVKDYYTYRYNVSTKEIIIEKPKGAMYGASSKFEALFSFPKECYQKYKIKEYVKKDFVIYEEFDCICSKYKCGKDKYESRGVDIIFKGEFDYSKIEYDTNKKIHAKYLINNYREPGYYYQPDEFDKDAYIELFEDGTFNVSKFNKIYKGKYKIVKYKYDVYDESVLLDFDDKSIASIRFKILKDDSFCNRSTCKGDLSNYSFSDNFKLVGDWIKEK